MNPKNHTRALTSSYIVNCIFRRIVSAVRSAGCENHARRWTRVGLWLTWWRLYRPSCLCSPPFPVQTDKRVGSAARPLLSPTLRSLRSPSLGLPSGLPSTTWGQYRARKASVEGPQGCTFYFKMEIHVQYLHSPHPAELVLRLRFYQCKHHANVLCWKAQT